MIMKTTITLTLLAVIIASVMSRRLLPIRSDKGEYSNLHFITSKALRNWLNIAEITSFRLILEVL